MGNSDDLRRAVFNKIINNIENLIKRYDDKLNNLAKPLTKEEILIDLNEYVNGSKDPESKLNNLKPKINLQNYQIIY